MKLAIEIRKQAGKRSILQCTRQDGTSTYAPMHPNLEIHDIAHYVIETQLNFTKAFYGLIAAGYTISDFELPKNERPIALHPKNLHAQALISEHLANILQTMYLQSNPDVSFLQIITTILKENELPFPSDLTAQKLSALHAHLVTLMTQWKALPASGKLELNFEVQTK